MTKSAPHKILILFNMHDEIGNKVGSGHVRSSLLYCFGDEKESQKYDDVLGTEIQKDKTSYEALERVTHKDGSVADYMDARRLHHDAVKIFAKGHYDQVIFMGGYGGLIPNNIEEIKKGAEAEYDDEKIKHQIQLIQGLAEWNKNPENKATHILRICLGGEIVSTALDGCVTNNFKIVLSPENGTEYGMHPIGFDDVSDDHVSLETEKLYKDMKDIWQTLPTWQWHNYGYTKPNGSKNFLKNTAIPKGAPDYYDNEHKTSQGFVLACNNGANIIGMQSHPEATLDFHLKEGKQFMLDEAPSSVYQHTNEIMCQDAESFLSNQATTHHEAINIKDSDPAINLVRIIKFMAKIH